MLYTMDEGIGYLFINIRDLAVWIYGNPGKKELINISVKIHKARMIKRCRREKIVCIIVKNNKYKIELARV